MRSLALSALLLAACHHHTSTSIETNDKDLATSSTPTDMAQEAPPDLAQFVTAQHAAFPQIANQGGTVLAAPHLVTITFSDYGGDDDALSAYSDWLVTSDYLTTVGAEYGVGAGTHTHVHLTTAAPTTANNASTAKLVENLVSTNKVPATDANTVYMVFYWSNTNLTDAPGPCMADYAPGYHSDTIDGNSIAYGVVGACTEGGDKQTQLTLSHELVEAATDPHPNAAPAFYFPVTSPWYYTAGEVADLCDQPISYMDNGATDWIVRIWSNKQAALNGDPCLPTRTEPFFYVSGPSTSVTGTAGQDVNVVLTAWSTAPHDKWGVQAASVQNDQANDPVVTAVDKAEVQNGDQVTLTVTVPTSAQSGEQLPVLVYSISEVDNLDYMAWPIVITVN